MPNHYLTMAEMKGDPSLLFRNELVSREQQAKDVFNKLETSRLQGTSVNDFSSVIKDTTVVQLKDSDKDLLMKISKGEVSLTQAEKDKLWTVTSPGQLQEMLSSKRDKLMGKEFCSKKRIVDDWGRPADINSLDYYNCAGDDPSISIDRENRVTRLAYDDNYNFRTNIPYGLRMSGELDKFIPLGLKL
jgi:hypothetical protein